MIVIHKIFSLTLPLSVALQAKNNDLASAIEMADNLSDVLKELREESKDKFNDMFANAQNLANNIGIHIKIPRVTARQCHRSNYETDSLEEYFRLPIFLPFLDHFILQLRDF